ncbi:transglycosylase domain-containing protein [Streptomyces sp. NBC_01268]|uniref:transglycosylase domain-containing protein n=1 Tax=unclassified Streptomyces TaxID=2593676 RepID=UPI002E2EF9E4|nr:transglycosylase domain-containing protein [Streptomyces sp. NBC_01268]
MSEHRRKMPQQQPPSGGRAAARRAAQQPMGHRPAQGHDVGSGSPSDSYGPPSAYGEEQRPYGGRAEARRAAQRGGRRRAPEAGGPGGPSGPGGGRRGGGGGGQGGGPGRGRGGRPPGKKRIIDYPRYGKYGWRRWMPSWKLVTGLFLAFCGGLLGAASIAYAMVGIPDVDKTAVAQNNVFYWSDGTQMAATGGEVNRQIVGIEQIPKSMQNAVVSAENKTFWTDSGIDPMGIGRAVWNMAKGGETQGGSTITQQYVKNNRLNDQSQTLTRKVKELFISMRVGNDLEKPDIMAGYLNTSYYGRGAYGIQAAARTYFGKDANKLNASESAFLASLLKGATYYDPAGSPEIDPAADAKSNRERAEKRWKWILDEMVKDGNLPAAERAKYTKFPTVKGRTQGAQLSGQIGYLVRTAEANFLNNNDRNIGAQQLAQGGFEIHTTFDKKKVKALETAVKKVYDEHIKPEKRPKTDTHVQFGGASVDPKTGAIVAIYGGTDATKHFTNNADQTGAQVGSTFKPFVLAAAMRDGVRDKKLGPEQGPSSRTIVDPDKSVYNGQNKLRIKNYDGTVWHDENGNEWLQTNDDDASYKNMSLREAMERSANSPYVQLGMDVGIDQVRKSAVDAGLLESSLIKANVPSFSLGISSPSAIRMAGAYSTFANNGEHNDPFSVTKVLQRGETIYEHKAAPKRAFSTAVASNVTDVLKDVVKKGTGKKAALDDREAAGKTGTTDGNNSAWFVGYTPQLSTAIDMYRFADDETIKDRKFESMFGTGAQPKIHGSSFPSQIWHDYMTDALSGTKAIDFPDPEDLGAEAVFGGGAVSPTPTPTETESESPSATATTQTPTMKPTKTADPGKTCSVWDWPCDPNGGTSNGNDNGGASNGGATTTPPPTSTDSPSTDPATTGGGGKPNGGTGWTGLGG